MSDDNVYKTVTITGSSSQGIDDAINKGIGRANETLRQLDWFKVTEIRGHIEDGKPAHVQVTMEIGFKLE